MAMASLKSVTLGIMGHPTYCLVEKPHPHSVDFGGGYINLKMLSRATGVHHTHLSRVFNGLRPIPSVPYCRMLAEALGMGLTDFIDALEDRAAREMDLRLQRRRVVSRGETAPHHPRPRQHTARILHM